MERMGQAGGRVGMRGQAFTQHEFFYNFVYDWTILSTKGVLSVSVVQAANLTERKQRWHYLLPTRAGRQGAGLSRE